LAEKSVRLLAGPSVCSARCVLSQRADRAEKEQGIVMNREAFELQFFQATLAKLLHVFATPRGEPGTIFERRENLRQFSIFKHLSKLSVWRCQIRQFANPQRWFGADHALSAAQQPIQHSIAGILCPTSDEFAQDTIKDHREEIVE